VARRKKGISTVYVISIGAHVLLALGIIFIPQKQLREVVAIAFAETTKHDDKPKPERQAPPRAESHASRAAMARAAAEPAAQAETTRAAPVFADIGLSLDSSSMDGLPIRMAPTAQGTVAAKSDLAPAKPKLLVAKTNEVPCTEELVKAVPLSRPSPSYTPEAENAGVEGKVRLELKVDEHGNVESAKVLQGLGYGLDETAVQTVKRWQFKPATMCGKPVAATFVVSVVFSGS
jgi:protein TonB